MPIINVRALLSAIVTIPILSFRKFVTEDFTAKGNDICYAIASEMKNALKD